MDDPFFKFIILIITVINPVFETIIPFDMDGLSGASTQMDTATKFSQQPQQFESYKKVKVLGQGSFGKAFLV